MLFRALSIALILSLLGPAASATCVVSTQVSALSQDVRRMLLGDQVARASVDAALRSFNHVEAMNSLMIGGRPDLYDTLLRYLVSVERLAADAVIDRSLANRVGSEGMTLATELRQTACGAQRSMRATPRRAAAPLAGLQPLNEAKEFFAPQTVGGPSPRAVSYPRVGGAAALVLILLSLLWMLRRRILRSISLGMRTHERHACQFPTTLSDGKHSWPCIVVDVSVYGCKITLPSDLPDVAELTIATPEGDKRADLRWRNSHFAGLLLKTPLSAGTIKSLVELRA